ncbi:MAG: DUF3800 domain-containing protein [Bacteroidaceae bacterium]|nr:DUF3800 domain-containing protein [Bacteroidaceae bacterium]
METFSPTFPIFTLCGILVRDDKVSLLEEQVRTLKQEFWGDRQIILHSRDIRKCQNGFEILFDLDVKRRFYEAVNRLLGQKDVYVIVCCSILKEPYIRQFGKLNDVYGQSLSFVLERAIFCVDNQCQDESGRISAIVERRGKREDRNLKNYYGQLIEKGTYWVTAERMKNRMTCLDFKWKNEDIAGLQVADLIAYPLTRHVLNPQSVNLAYDVLEPNIFMENGKLMGLKVYPHQP